MLTKDLRKKHNLSRSAAVAISDRTAEGIAAYKSSQQYQEKQIRRQKADARWGRADRTPVYAPKH